ncbi:transposase [Streptomyces sp. NPDC001978]|uniref:transposase n=1 Tax=Streptomyces sp. NPDC001978 TaxID=3364627 RepID=UPI00367D8FBF
MSERTGWDRGLSVAADGKGLVGHAGAVLLRRLADRVGLTRGLAGVLPSSTSAGWRERAGVLVQLAVAMVLRARSLLEAEQLQLHHQGLFGPAASDSTMRRLLAELDDKTLTRIAKVRRRVRRHVWPSGDRPGRPVLLEVMNRGAYVGRLTVAALVTCVVAGTKSSRR